MAGTALAGPPIDGTGTVGTCSLNGSIKLKPALVTGGTSAGGVKAKAKSVTCGGGTMDGANVVSFKAKGVGTTTSNDCANLIGPQPSTLALSVKWKVSKGSPKLNASTITFTSQNGGFSGDLMHGSFALTGSVTAGSFNGNPVSVYVETDQTLTDLGTACGAKGIKKITFGLAGGSTAATL